MKIKHFLKKSAAVLIIVMVALTGCDEKAPAIIELDQSALPRTAWADETQGSKQVTFVAPAEWTSSIADATAAKAAAGTSSVKAATGNWVTISPESGPAGPSSVTITLLPNYTGEMRSATVTITSGEQTVSFVISQDGKKEDGTVPEDPGATMESTITFDGQVYSVVKTELGAIQQWFTDDANMTAWLHIMKFYSADNFYVELSLVTNSQTFTGGAFTFGDIQVNNMNKAAGSIYMPGAAGILTQEQFAWGSELRAVRADDNTLTVEFNRVGTNITKKEVSMKFSGPFENTETPDEFVPVRNIAFPDEHALTTLKAGLNTVCQLTEAMVQPNTATNQGVKWTSEGATLNGLSLTFNEAGTATITATIREGMLGGDGTKADYIQIWKVVVGEDHTNPEPNPEKMITINGTEHPIVSAEHTVANYAASNGAFTAKCHKLKFYINNTRYAEVTIINNNDVLTTGQYTFVTTGTANAVGTAESYFNCTTATGMPDCAQKGGNVRVVVDDANDTVRVEFMTDVTTQMNNQRIYLLYVGDFTE